MDDRRRLFGREQRRHGGSAAIIDHQVQQFRARVVAHRIHHALALGDQRHVQVGHQDAFAAAQRLGQQLAFGRDDGGTAAAAQRLLRLGRASMAAICASAASRWR
jgi:hypothetical protein